MRQPVHRARIAHEPFLFQQLEVSAEPVGGETKTRPKFMSCKRLRLFQRHQQLSPNPPEPSQRARDILHQG